MTDERPTARTVEVEVSPRPLYKSDRAADLFMDLEASVRQFNASHRIMAPVRKFTTIPATVQFYRPEGLNERIPWAEWDALFHDGIHNLRAALDGMVFDFAHIEQQPTNPGHISFPITQHPNEWRNRAAKLSAIPAALLERIRQCQPWCRPDPQDPDPLALLSRIDNDDKHRTVSVRLDVAPFPNWDDSAEVPLAVASNDDWPLEPWLRLTLDNYSGRPQWDALVRVDVGPIAVFRDYQASLLEAARWLHSEVRRAIQFLAAGEWPDGDYVRAEPGPVWNALNTAD